jgi:hypothetical protein
MLPNGLYFGPISGIIGLRIRSPATVSTTPTRQRRYVTWRLPDRHFSKVHLVGEPGSTLCGRALPRATGAPHPPIPESEMCTECAAADA